MFDIKFNLGLVVESVVNDGSRVMAQRVNNLVNFCSSKNPHTYLINLLDDPVNADGTINVYSALTGESLQMPLSDFDVVHIGHTSQRLSGTISENSLQSNSKRVFSFLETLNKFPSIKVSNPVDLMVWNISKDYLFELVEDEFPIIEVHNIKSKKQLLDLQNSETDYMLKPLIAERGNGAALLSSLNDSEIDSILDEFVLFEKSTKQDLHSDVANRQGLLAQKFCPNLFLNHGEIKSMFIGSNCMSSKVGVYSKDSTSDSLDFIKKYENVPHTPSSAELALGKKLIDYISKKIAQPVFCRVDIVSLNDEEIYLNEFELINPFDIVCEYDFESEQVQTYYSELFSSFIDLSNN